MLRLTKKNKKDIIKKINTFAMNTQQKQEIWVICENQEYINLNNIVHYKKKG